jgi:hypothetical protein
MLEAGARSWPGIVLAAALAAMPAVARAGCIWPDLVQEEARAATARPGAPRTHFVQDEGMARGCPSESAACLARAFLLPGDTVLTGPAQGAYTCAGFVGAKGATTIGWLPSAVLTPLPKAEQRPADWAGHWLALGKDLTIAAGHDGALLVSGNAT